VGTVAVLVVVGRPLQFASLDADVAGAAGVPVALLSLCFLLLLGVAVAATSQITGALLVFALLVTPPATALELTSRPLPGLALSIGIGVAVTWFGLALAYFSIYPAGFYITSLAFTAYVSARVARWTRRR
jgi:zinc/manganese transport system permease protein